MSLEWDSRIIAVDGGVDISKSPRRYTYKNENFCPYCNCPRSHVEKLKKIKSKFIKPANQFLLQHLQNNNLKLFEIPELINSLNANFLTDGSFQNKQMTLFVLMGLYNRTRQEFIVKKGKKKEKEFRRFRWIFTKKWSDEKPKCYIEEKDSHITLDKDEWVKTKYFDDKSRGEEDDES